MKNIELTNQEISIIQSALNAYWHDANNKLSCNYELMSNGEKRTLGDIEKDLYNQQAELTLPLLLKFEDL